ncbi:MAG: hypothetical protein K9K86_10705, partial [Pseudomonadales bacterium]|nr:hypothetical protein [Pseudomonadales bacterium]
MPKDNWKNYLHSQGAEFCTHGETQLVSYFNSSTDNDQLPSSFITPLMHQALLNIAGPDSAKFMQGQLTCDVNAISPKLSTLGAACTPKGRIYTSFRLIQRDNNDTPHFLLRMRKDIIDSTIATLSKYIVFFKSKMTSLEGDWVGIGIKGDSCDNLLNQFFGSIPTEINQVVQNNKGILICLPGANMRYEAWLPNEQAQTLWPQLTAIASSVGTFAWILEDIRAGIAEVSKAITEAFIPQALNFQAINAISFTKGCYTGQEIVARTQYRGKAKRLMLRVRLEGAPPLSPGMDLFDAETQKNIATLVDTVTVNDQQQEALLVAFDDLTNQSDWQLSDGTNHFIGHLLELPYRIDEP